MNVLIIGSGAREQAIAWKVAQSSKVQQIFVAPGNPGTAATTAGKGENVAIGAENASALAEFATRHAVDLAIIGPETALQAGVSDALRTVGIRVFGPSQRAAEIETSKSFSKAFMQRLGISTARFACFTDYDAALAHLNSLDYPTVLKTSGLAGGKGVLVPHSIEEARQGLHQLMVERVFGNAGQEVVIEEWLEGEEVSLLAFTDGLTVSAMPPAQDHKRLSEGDHGPNTGGMGAYAPAPICPPELAQAITRAVLQPAVDGLRAEGRPFVGVLYAGIMLTAQGAQVLEFNCRFGDPETQVILPLLESDLVEILEACVDGHLSQVQPRWKVGSAACVVLASEGYPGQPALGKKIHGAQRAVDANEHRLLFHAGTQDHAGELVTAGGRVFAITGLGRSLQDALTQAYTLAQTISFEGMQYRKDIGARAYIGSDEDAFGGKPSNTYAKSGVNIDAGNRAVELMRDAVRATYTPAVLAGIGSFGGLFDASALKEMSAPVLVASTDGVGTKVRLGAATGRYTSLGVDIVNHCINDILVQAAKPLFFLDYFATAHLQPEIAAQVVTGAAQACLESGCVLLGGETAEMPGVYQPDEFDLAGTIVGVVDRAKILPRRDLAAGDLLVGLRSNGAHTNGYSLIRKVFENVPLDTVFPELGVPLADVLLATHRSYLPVLAKVLAQTDSPIKALAHLTGGGFIENIPRVLPEGLKAIIWRGSWPVPPLFALIQKRGKITWQEMYRVFNLGIGMVIVVAPEQAARLQHDLPEESWIIGELAQGEKGVGLQ